LLAFDNGCHLEPQPHVFVIALDGLSTNRLFVTGSDVSAFRITRPKWSFDCWRNGWRRMPAFGGNYETQAESGT
jgi:hypothetical protein